MSVRSQAQAKAEGMSGAGLLVVATMCGALLLVVLAACWLALRGEEIPDALDRVIQGLLIGVPALLARTHRDTGTEENPASVNVVNDLAEAIPTTDVASSSLKPPEPDFPAVRRARPSREG